MSQTVKLKRSAVPSKIPTTTDVDLGELAINTYDGKLFLKKDDGSESIVEIGSGGGSSIFGSENQNAESAGQSSTTSTTWQQKLRMTTPSLPSGDYRIEWYAELRASIKEKACEIRVQVNDTTTIGNSAIEAAQDWTDVLFGPADGFKIDSFSGVLNIDIDFRRGGDDGTAYIRNTRLFIYRIS